MPKNVDIIILSLLSLETITKITPWSLDCTSEFRQLFTSGKDLPQTDWNVKDGIHGSRHNIGICCRLDLVLKRKSGLVNERQNINFIVNIFCHLCGLLLFYITVSPLLKLNTIQKILIFCLSKKNLILHLNRRGKKTFRGLTGTIKPN